MKINQEKYNNDLSEEVIVSKQELFLLKKIAKTSYNIILGKIHPDFRSANGGENGLENANLQAVSDYKKWLLDNKMTG